MTVRLRAPAKVNLSLRVLRRREDGYHDVATTLLAVEAFDRLQVEPDAAPTSSCATAVPTRRPACG